MRRGSCSHEARNASLHDLMLSWLCVEQMLMIWAVEHDELWVHKGFLQVYTLLLAPCTLPCKSASDQGISSAASSSWKIYLALCKAKVGVFCVQAYTSVSDVLMRTVDDIMKAGTKKSMDELQEAGQKSGLRAIRTAADAAADKVTGKDQWHIYTTGHSMGGALATLCADELAVRSCLLIPLYAFRKCQCCNLGDSPARGRLCLAC